jgi:hypothetical protein
MKLDQFITTCILLLGFGASSPAQNRETTNAVVHMDLPAGNDAWVVQLLTSGGLFGMGQGNFAVSSEGRKACSPPEKCTKDLIVAAFKPLVDAIQPGNVTITRPLPSLCNDCYVRTIVIRRRDSKGVLHIYAASWDDLSKDAIPREVVQIYEAVLGLGN